MIATGLRHVCFVAAAMAATAPVAVAADASDWDADARSGMRLIAGNASDEARRAGIELRISPGWKTYWRYPGDSGVPPRFDFSQSTNVKSIDVRWPAPHRFPDGAGFSIGYRDAVIFPLRIVAKDASQPVMLRLNLAYAVCEKLCVPVDAKAELQLSGGGKSSQDAALAAAEAHVPKPATLGEGNTFAVRAVSRETSGGRPRVIVDVVAPERAAVDLFAEGPSPEWALPLPAALPGAPAGQRRFAFDLDGLPPGAKAADPTALTLTAVAADGAIEVKAHLD